MEDFLYTSAPGSDSWKYVQDIKVSKLFMNSGYDECIVESPLPPRVMPTIDVKVNHGIWNARHLHTRIWSLRELLNVIQDNTATMKEPRFIAVANFLVLNSQQDA